MEVLGIDTVRMYQGSEVVVNEVESTLIIVSDDPQKVTQNLSRLTELVGLNLVPEAPKDIRDLYFDTPDHQLENELLSLRLRFQYRTNTT